MSKNKDEERDLGPHYIPELDPERRSFFDGGDFLAVILYFLGWFFPYGTAFYLAYDFESTKWAAVIGASLAAQLLLLYGLMGIGVRNGDLADTQRAAKVSFLAALVWAFGSVIAFLIGINDVGYVLLVWAALWAAPVLFLLG
ncbi:MAG: hypothetical protein AAGB02_03775 [Pseudomonadota bacterium]